MTWLPETIQERLAIVLLHFVWQGALIAGLSAVWLSMLRGSRLTPPSPSP